MVDVRTLKPGDEPLVAAFCRRRPDTTVFFANNVEAVGVVDRGERYQGTYAAALAGGEVQGLAAHYWNGALIVDAPQHLAEVVATAVRASRREVGQILGLWDQTCAARDALGLKDAPMAMEAPEVLYALDLVDLRVPAVLATGRYRLRPAEEDDMPTIGPWRVAYRVEALGETNGPELQAESEAGLRAWVASGRMWVLEHEDRLVSMTGFNSRTREVVQVGGVWTPPELRSRGYARAAVAASLLDARDGGALRSVLFTDEDNVSARKCYEGLGYQAIGEYGLLVFRERCRPFAQEEA